MGLLDVARQAEQAQLGRDVNMSRHGMLNDDTPLQRAQYGGMYGSLMQDPADKARMERQMMEDTMAMMPIAGMTTYHGSPHIFNKFRMDKIGTGEGAQAYGHGLYLAENPNVAKDYAEKLGADYNWKKIRENVNLDFDRGYVAKRPDGTEKVFTNESDAIRWVEDVMSNLYKVDLPDNQIKKMLDWDAPLSKQHEEALTKNLPRGYLDQSKSIFGNSGEAIMKGMRDRFTQPEITDIMRKSNIPGIKYLDQGSRGAGQGTRNFVVFDENIPQILERNQQPIGGLLGK
jgi:hypothetical protein